MNDGDPARQRQHLVQIARVHHDGCSRRGSSSESRSNRRSRSDIETARGILYDEKLRRAIQLTRKHELLLIPARQASRLGLRRAPSNVEFAQKLGGVITSPSE